MSNLVAYLISAVIGWVFSAAAADTWKLTGGWQTAVGFAAWFLFLFAFITPFNMWRDLVKKNGDLAGRLDRRATIQAALLGLRDIFRNGTHFLNDLARKSILTTDDHLKLHEYEEEIKKHVEAVSPPEVGRFEVIRTWERQKHPQEYWPEQRNSDVTLICFSERLARIDAFILKHTVPDTR